ncbi:MAG: hypothetical protein QGM49_02195, partial [Actinomycetota bacterium]|nr:hypothetical protein [Actinomycetota bacterium]
TYAPLRHKGRSAATEGTGVTLFEHLREMALATAGEASGNNPCGDSRSASDVNLQPLGLLRKCEHASKSAIR